MAETFTMNETPANSEVLNSDEQESLEVAESLERGDQPLLAGKYKNTQELEQAYKELEKKLGEDREEPAAETPEQGEEADDSDSADVEVLTQEQAEFLMESVGGEKAYQNMLSWASDNFSAEEVEMYDAIMSKGDPNAVFFAVEALKARYNDNQGNDGQLLTGRGAGSEDDSFKSQAELVAAMGDPRYERDPAYRSEVMRRLENSDVEF